MGAEKFVIGSFIDIEGALNNKSGATIEVSL